ncbi:integrase [Actinosynnema sp. CA-299493]
MRFPIRDRDRKYPALFDAVLADTGIQIVLSGVRIPHMNTIMECWIHNCRRELLDHTLIRNQQHLLHALREYEHLYDNHRHDIRRRQRLGCILNECQRAA